MIRLYLVLARWQLEKGSLCNHRSAPEVGAVCGVFEAFRNRASAGFSSFLISSSLLGHLQDLPISSSFASSEASRGRNILTSDGSRAVSFCAPRLDRRAAPRDEAVQATLLRSERGGLLLSGISLANIIHLLGTLFTWPWKLVRLTHGAA
jgi:hypothetical protein